jgi:thiamine biosynthesis lipoprotein
MDRRLGEIWLKDRALGTSGAQFQSFRHRGRRYGHILDPRTGWPAEGVLSATVLAPTAALADALSTACYVLGPQAALAYCREQPELAAVIVCPGRGGGGLEIHATQPAPWSAEHTLE